MTVPNELQTAPDRSHKVEGLSFTQERLDARKKTLGASEIAAVAGLNPYRSPLDVYLEKRGVVQPFQGNEFTEWGLRLEAVIASVYAERMSAVLEPSETVISRVDEWMSATPDRIAKAFGEAASIAAVRGLECKNKSARQAMKFGESGSDQVPHDIAAQCHWSMMVTGLRVWDVAVLFGGNEFRWFRLEYSQDIAEAFYERGHDFWFNNVVKGVEPEVDGSERWAQHIKSKFAKHSDVIRDATQEEYRWLKDLQKTRDMVKRFEADEATLVNKLKNSIGECAGIQCTAGRITWKRTADTHAPDYQAIALELASRLQLSLDEQKQLVEAHTVVTKQGSRRFLPTFPKD